MIEIMNQTHCKPTEPYDVIVDRRGILGNPFFLFDEDDRDKVCDLYAKRFEVVKNEPAYKEKLEELLSILKKHGKIRLFCWCAPKRCHAETIKKWLEGNIKKEEECSETVKTANG